MNAGPSPLKTIIILVLSIIVIGIIFAFLKTFTAGDLQGNLVREEGSIHAYFCQVDDCEKIMLDELGKADKIECAFYDLDLETVKTLLAQKNVAVKLHDPNRTEGLMHHKFCVMDNQKVFTGSTNPTENGVQKNDNNLLVIDSRTIALRYLQEYEQIGGRKYRTTPRYINVSGTLIQLLFCPQEDCERAVVDEINKAQHSVEFMTFSFTSDPIGEALLNAQDRGVQIVGVMEKRQNSQYSEYSKLRNFSVDVVWDGNPATMHHKVFIIDNETVITGSMNPTWSGAHQNDENLLIIDDPEIAQQYLQEYARVRSAAS